MSANEKKDLKNLTAKEIEAQQAERVRGGAGPIDSKKPTLSGPKPAGPIDG